MSLILFLILLLSQSLAVGAILFTDEPRPWVRDAAMEIAIPSRSFPAPTNVACAVEDTEIRVSWDLLPDVAFYSIVLLSLVDDGTLAETQITVQAPPMFLAIDTFRPLGVQVRAEAIQAPDLPLRGNEDAHGPWSAICPVSLGGAR